MEHHAAIPYIRQTESSLLSLPAELRNSIYELVLSIQADATEWDVNRPSAVVTIKPVRTQTSTGHCSSLDILLVCRQVRTEAESLFYSLNHIRYVLDGTYPSFRLPSRSDVSTKQASAIRRHFPKVSFNIPKDPLTILDRLVEPGEELMPAAGLYATVTTRQRLVVPRPLQSCEDHHALLSLYRDHKILMGERATENPIIVNYSYHHSFIRTLTPRRLHALQAVSLHAEMDPVRMLQELEHELLPNAPNLHTLHLEIGAKAWSLLDWGAWGWAAKAHCLLRPSNIKMVNLELSGLTFGHDGCIDGCHGSQCWKAQSRKQTMQEIDRILKEAVVGH